MSLIADSPWSSRQVHLVSTAGIAIKGSETKADLMFYFKTPIFDIPATYNAQISCVSCSIPYSWLNITSSNNRISLYIADQEGYEFTSVHNLAIGQYSITDIITYLNQRLTITAFATFGMVATYSQATHTITITSSTGTAYIGLFSGSLVDLLGISRAGAPYSFPFTSSKLINLLPTTSVYVETVGLLNESYDSRLQGQSGVLCRVPVNGAFNSMLTWVNTFHTRTQLSVKNLNNLRIRLLDDARNTLDLNGYTWSITLQFDIVSVKPFLADDTLDRETLEIPHVA